MIRTQVKTIGPKEAKHLLSLNAENQRPVSQQALSDCIYQIKNDKWCLNGEAIKIGKSGKVIDGQHRLMAVIECDKPIKTLVVDNIEDEHYITLDSGKSRSNADIFAIEQIPNYKNVSSVSLRLSKVLSFAPHRLGDIIKNRRQARIYDKQAILDTYKANSELIDGAILTCSDKSLTQLMPLSYWATLYFAAYLKDETRCNHFFSEMISHPGSSGIYCEDVDFDSHPVSKLKDKYLQQKIYRSQGKPALGFDVLAAYFVLAFNAYGKDKPIRQFRFSYEEKFPVIE